MKKIINHYIYDDSNPVELSPKEYTGIAKALYDYRVEVLQLHKNTETLDCIAEKYHSEKAFRLAITADLRNLIELSCASCPAGYSKNNCLAKQCPFKTLNEILDDKLNQLNQILPGGING